MNDVVVPSVSHATLRLRLGVDSGGTFTDICMLDETSGEVHVWKLSSTPDDPSIGSEDTQP